MSESDEYLIEHARLARLRSVAPFSNFHVGAAIQTAAGKVFSGCNIESASYGLTVCAERVAIWKAVSEGERDFARLVIVTDATPLTPPCGACRQVIWEFCRDATIVLVNLDGQREELRIAALLPHAFDEKSLKGSRKLH